MSALIYAARWSFTAVFGGALAFIFMFAALAVAVFCIAGALGMSVCRRI